MQVWRVVAHDTDGEVLSVEIVAGGLTRKQAIEYAQSHGSIPFDTRNEATLVDVLGVE